MNGELPISDEWFKIYLWDYVYYHYNEPHTNKLPENFDIRQLSRFIMVELVGLIV